MHHDIVFSFCDRLHGPKVDAACRFEEVTGKTAAIGALGYPGSSAVARGR